MTPEEVLALLDAWARANNLIPDEQPPEPPPSSDYLSLTFTLYEDLRTNPVNWPEATGVYLRAVEGLMDGPYRSVLDSFAFCVENVDDDVAGAASLKVLDWARYLGEQVVKEGSEPGIYRTITDGEMFDSFWSLLDRKVRPWAIGNYGYQGASWVVGALQLCKWWAMALGESLGAGEKQPPGAGNPDLPPGVTPPWSGP